MKDGKRTKTKEKRGDRERVWNNSQPVKNEDERTDEKEIRIREEKKYIEEVAKYRGKGVGRGEEMRGKKGEWVKLALCGRLKERD